MKYQIKFNMQQAYVVSDNTKNNNNNLIMISFITWCKQKEENISFI